jgi:hypothetical protein
MSSKQVQLRRGTASEHGSFTGAAGELTYVTDDKTLRIHDGATAGGIKALTEGIGTTNISNNLAVNTDKMTVASATGNTVIAGTLDVTGDTSVAGIVLTEKSADPSDPAEGKTSIWQSDGTGAGDDGDIMLKITAGGATKTVTLVDFSAV